MQFSFFKPSRLVLIRTGCWLMAWNFRQGRKAQKGKRCLFAVLSKLEAHSEGGQSLETGSVVELFPD